MRLVTVRDPFSPPRDAGSTCSQCSQDEQQKVGANGGSRKRGWESGRDERGAWRKQSIRNEQEKRQDAHFSSSSKSWDVSAVSWRSYAPNRDCNKSMAASISHDHHKQRDGPSRRGNAAAFREGGAFRWAPRPDRLPPSPKPPSMAVSMKEEEAREKEADVLASIDLGDISHLEDNFKLLVTDQEDLECPCESIFHEDLKIAVDDNDLDAITEANNASIMPSSQPKMAHKSENNGNSSLANKDKTPIPIDFSEKFKLGCRPVLKEVQFETDPHRISQRQRQIQYGKNTLGYERYTELIPKYKRKKKDPYTPDYKQTCSKRSWDGQIKKWRRLLHFYDPPMEEGEELPVQFSKHHMEEESSKKTETSPLPSQEDTKTDHGSIYGDWDEMEI